MINLIVSKYTDYNLLVNVPVQEWLNVLWYSCVVAYNVVIKSGDIEVSLFIRKTVIDIL